VDRVDPETTVAIALGSNLGDRCAHLEYAVRRLQASLTDVVASEPIETEPVGVGPQPLFLNAALAGRTRLSPRELLDLLLRVEHERGRERPSPGSARTLDLDLILFGGLVVEEPGLQIPHPRFRERRFVLEPLAAVAPGLVDPVTGLTAAALLERLIHRER
jgi:2-amino-4-hydroxy-6-hydroxymethyldihydropteridine diphosphokinase